MRWHRAFAMAELNDDLDQYPIAESAELVGQVPVIDVSEIILDSALPAARVMPSQKRIRFSFYYRGHAGVSIPGRPRPAGTDETHCFE